MIHLSRFLRVFCLLTLSFSLGSAHAARLYETNLIVVRVGDGTQALSTSGNSAFLDQYSTAGNYVDSLPITNSGPTGVVLSGNSFVEGYLTRSADARLLCLAAYGTNLGAGIDITTAPATAVPRVVATFNALASYSQALASTSDYSSVSWRATASDGSNNFWGAGSGAGTIYLGKTSARAVIQSSKANCRVVQIFNGNLYMSSASTAGDALTGIYKFNGLPKTATALPVPFIFTNTFTSPSGITDFAINPSNTIVYFADERAVSSTAGGIQRWDINATNGVWSNSYHLVNGLGSVGVSHVEVDWSGSNPVIYATTAGLAQNKLVKVTDAGAGSPILTLVTAGTNQLLRGVRFGPVFDALAITSDLSSLTNSVGTTASFVVGASGTGPLSYQWSVNGTNLADSLRFSGSQSSNLVVANVQPADAGDYRVVINNGFNSVTSAVATLTVNPLVLPAATLALWLRADSGITTNASGRVFSWSDQSGFAHIASQITAGSQPSFVNAGLGGKPVVRFGSGGNSFLDLDGQILTNTVCTIFAVLNDSSIGSSSREIFSNWATTNTTNSVFFGLTKNNPVQARFTDHFQAGGVGSVTNPAAHFTLTGVSGVTNMQLFQNQTRIAVTNNPLSARVLTTPFALGRQGSLNGEYWQGDLAEFLVYTSELSTTERAQVWAYLENKYSQPYFTLPPLDQSIALGGTLFLSAPASSLNPVTYQWRFNGTNLTDGGRITGARSSALMVTGMSSADAGAYQVVATTQFGSSVTGASVAVVAARNLVWRGLPNGNWDTTTSNWLSAATSVEFNPGDFVTFDDSLAGGANVVLTTSMFPGGVTVNNSASNYVFTGNGGVRGSGSLTKNGPGVLTLASTGGDDFSGGVAVNNGTLILAGSNSAMSGGLSIAGPASVFVGLNDGRGNLPAGNTVLNGSLTFNRTNTMTVGNIISGAGSGVLIKTNSNLLILSGNNRAFTGAVTVVQGTLRLASANAAGSGTNTLITISSGATLDLNGVPGTNAVAASGAGIGNNGVIVNNGTALGGSPGLAFLTLLGDATIGGSGRWDLRSSGSVNPLMARLSTAGQPFNLTKTGANFISLANATIDPALANVTIQNGTLEFNGTSTSLGNPASTLTVAATATFQCFGFTNQLDKRIVLIPGATVANADGVNTIIGPVTLSTNGAGAVGNCVFNIAGTSLAFNNVIDGPSGLAKSGAGKLFLTATNTYGGSTLVNTGTLSLGVSGSIAASTNITIAAGAVLDAAERFDHTLALASGQTLRGNGTLRGTLIAGPGSLLSAGTNSSALGALTVSGDVILQGATLVKISAATGTNDQITANAFSCGGSLMVTNLAGVLASGDRFKVLNAGSYSNAFGSIVPPTPGPDTVWDTNLLASQGILGVLATNSLAIFFQPQPLLTRYVGGSVPFSIVAGSTAPISYQWFFETSPIPGATNSLLSLNALQLASSGNYRCLVSNAFGSILSSNSFLSVLPQPTNGNGTVPAPAGLVHWWPGESNANDIVSACNGTIQNPVTYVSGKVGSAFHLDGLTSRIDIGITNLPVPWTACFWVNRQNSPATSAALMGDTNTSLKLEQYNGTRQVGITHFGDSDLSFGYIAPTGSWVHLVFRASETNITLFTNGIAQSSLPVSFPLGRAFIGADFNGTLDHLLGDLDEIAIYSRALTVAEISDIYSAGNAGKSVNPLPPSLVSPLADQLVAADAPANFSINAFGTPPFTYQWEHNGLVLANSPRIYGAQSNSLGIANTIFDDAGSYRVVISNLYGSTTSAALLTVGAGLRVTPGTGNFILTWPAPYQLQTATNAVGIYADVPGATSPYTNWVDNDPKRFFRLRSPDAHGLVEGVAPTANGQFRLNASGISGYNYVIQASTNLTNWLSLQTNTVPFQFTDTNSTNFPFRFYRTLLFH